MEAARAASSRRGAWSPRFRLLGLCGTGQYAWKGLDGVERATYSVGHAYRIECKGGPLSAKVMRGPPEGWDKLG